MSTRSFDFDSASGYRLSGRLEAPETTPAGWAIFAHCFTCGKDNIASTRITRALAQKGIGVLRFDFAGLGASGGQFADFAALPTASGLVITPFADDLNVSVNTSRVTISRPDGLLLTPPQMPVGQTPSALARFGDGPSYLDFGRWGEATGGSSAGLGRSGAEEQAAASKAAASTVAAMAGLKGMRKDSAMIRTPWTG